ncbi:MAG TPA: PIN domain-containing protein [Solirubrobacteraceae bacterium]|nr:PIN domain-containing protein [Solirubrobacteraceae bacterium]
MAVQLIDTSVLIDVQRGALPLEPLVTEGKVISVISVSELLHGVHRADNASRRLRREAVVEQILGAVEQVPIDSEVARVHASVWAGLQDSGEIIQAHDLWIAATALTHGLQLVTTNVRHFERVPGLSLLAMRSSQSS